jgi:hypothetical protein
LISNGFRASPADYPWPLMVHPRTIGNWVDGVAGGVGAAGRGGPSVRPRARRRSTGVAPGAALGGGAWRG